MSLTNLTITRVKTAKTVKDSIKSTCDNNIHKLQNYKTTNAANCSTRKVIKMITNLSRNPNIHVVYTLCKYTYIFNQEVSLDNLNE